MMRGFMDIQLKCDDFFDLRFDGISCYSVVTSMMVFAWTISSCTLQGEIVGGNEIASMMVFAWANTSIDDKIAENGLCWYFA